MRNFVPAAITAAALMLFLAPFAHAASNSNIPANPTLEQAVNGDWRTPAYAERDRYRHPVQTLEFFGIQPDMTVVELSPGGGWWTEFLAPYLKADGHLIETVPPADTKSDFGQRARARFLAKLEANPELYSAVTTVPFDPLEIVKFGPPGSADLVLTFRNLHNWVSAGDGSAEAVFRAAYAVLKPGGVFGVTEHRAMPNADPIESAKKLDRLTVHYVIKLGKAAGFDVGDVSEINANPKDPLTFNVHHLPPTLANDSAEENEKYLAIGESDRMTIRFVKPSSAKGPAQ